MKQSNKFLNDMLDFDVPEAGKNILWIAGKCKSVEEKDGEVILKVPFYAQKIDGLIIRDKTKEPQIHKIIVKAYGDSIIRFSTEFSDRQNDYTSEMLQIDLSLDVNPLTVKETETGWAVIDTSNRIRMRINTAAKPSLDWSELIPPPQDMFEASVYPDGVTEVPFMAYDSFVPEQIESICLGYIERQNNSQNSLFSLHAKYNEKFAGTGERFAPMNLAGRTILLENDDAFGVNSRRAYKNIPFYLSSRGYGLLILTSAHTRLSLADISTRAAQGLVENGKLDLFFIGGKNVEQITNNYRKLTGFPSDVPTWSYGVWMSRMSYFSAEEATTVGKRLRKEKFPCDVLHLDSGWFADNFICDWEFGKDNFPEPEKFIKQMKEDGFRITTWQTPYLYEKNKLVETAKDNKYLILYPESGSEAVSDFVAGKLVGVIDFSNPEAVKWYKGMLEKILKKGAVAIKTDFGEKVPAAGKSHSIPVNLLHNLYPLLYQKTAFEITKEITGDGIIWARAGWIGCQRYPVHWGGDTAATWDGLAATIRGGLHLGCSGFAFWSHDVPGFHSLPDFMNTKIDDDLYVRWTQVGVFSSHMRYHGTSPREPYNFPKVADIVRSWLQFRYALIPYLIEQGKKCTQTGYPMLRALIFHHKDDPICWNIDDEYYFGDDILVAPVLDAAGIRDVYLPNGSWTDLWTGKIYTGPQMLKNVQSDLSRIPVYAKSDSTIKVYPEIVQCTDEMDMSKAVNFKFDSDYTGLSHSVLANIGLHSG